MTTAAIIAIGDELTLGQTVDTNSAWLAQKLTERGVEIARHHTVADDIDAIAEAFEWLSTRCDLIIATGGLGPTDDDLTREGLAKALDSQLVLDEAALEQVQRFFAKRKYPMPDRNRCQAMRPESAVALENNSGTAPGLEVELNSANIYVFPGVPREMRDMFDRWIAPQLTDEAGRVILTSKLNTFGIGESNVAERLGDLAKRDRNPLIGTTVSRGIVSIRIRSDFPSRAEAESNLLAAEQAVKDALGELVFGREDQSLGEVVGQMLQANHLTLATAESCTGGMIGAMLTDISGSSAYYAGGWVVYSNQLKSGALGVDPQAIERDGAVSEIVAQQLAMNATEQANADLGIAVTGIAGPTGGSEDKPVGTVWIGLADRRHPASPRVEAKRFQLPGDRAGVRLRTAHMALNLVRLRLLETAPDRQADAI